MAESKIPYDGDSSWITIASSLKYKRVGRMVTVKGVSSGEINLLKNQWSNIGTLPQGYRPTEEIVFIAMDRNNIRAMMGTITNEGIAKLYPEVSDANYWFYEVTYPI